MNNDDYQQFLFHDLETGGLDRNIDQTYTFCGIKTDSDFNVIDRLDLSIRPTPDYFGSYGAYRKTGLLFTSDDTSLIRQDKAADKIYSFMLSPATIHTGYNSMSFDREVLRQLFFRNLMNPYAPEYSDGASCWDLLSLVRAVHDYNPKLLRWPVKEGGLPDLRLEAIMRENEHIFGKHDAHQASGDVEATIKLASFIKRNYPGAFSHSLRLRSKKTADAFLSEHVGQPILYTDSRFFSERGYTRPVMPICRDPHSLNAWLAADLTSEASIEALENGSVKGCFVRIPINKAPFMKDMKGIGSAVLPRFSTDERTLSWNAGRVERIIREVTERVSETEEPKYPPKEDVYEKLYDGFFKEEDNNMARMVRGTGNPEFLERIGNADLRLLAFRWLALFRPERLTDEQRRKWDDECRQKAVWGRGKYDGLARFIVDASADYDRLCREDESVPGIMEERNMALSAIKTAHAYMRAHDLTDEVGKAIGMLTETGNARLRKGESQ